MQRPSVISMSERRASRVARAIDARRRLRPTTEPRDERRGRMWLNGAELGTAEPAFAYLAESYD